MEMDKGFDFGALLRMQTHENKHKSKPTQFISVAGGVKKRIESNIQKKRKTRLTQFDNFRNLPQCEPPAQEPLNKMQQRKLLLQKWKEERQRKKKEAMANKKKPFVVGIAKNSLKFEPPPPMAWPLPSSSGCVTRSHSRSHITSDNQEKKIYKFAPENAAFNPTLRDLDIPSSSIFGQEKLEKNKAQEPRSLRSRTKVTDRIEGKLTQNTTTVLEKNTKKKKLPKKPLKEVNTIKSKAISSPTDSSSYDSHEDYVRKQGTRKGKKSAQTPKKDNTVITSTSNKKLVDISNGSSSMEIDFEKPLNSPKISTPNKIKHIVEDFITFTPKNPIPKSESSSEEKLRSPKPMDIPMTPEQIEEEARKISPRVCLSRGKDNMRREMKKRLVEGLLDGDVCDMSVEHFRRQLDSEIKRMTEMCETWDKILEQMTLPDEIQESVLSAVGQARLLMSQKFQQFASLLHQSENPEPGHQLVTRADLQGFWDMIFLQVENVDIRFKKLEESRARGWSIEEKPAAVARSRRPLKNKPAACVRPAPSNRLKDIIAAARKAKQASVNEDTKTFNAGFFSVQSPVKSPRAATPRRQPSLLQSVLSSEAKKSSAKNLYVVLRASMIGKNMDSGSESPCEANLDSLTPINLGLTPGKSILKSNYNTSTKVVSEIDMSAKCKKLHFALMSSSDTASDSSPIRDDGQISGVNFLDPVISPKLQHSDDSQHTSPRAHNIEKDQLKMPGASADDNNLVATDKANFEGKGNRRSSRRSVRNAGGKTDEENMAEDKKNKTDTENTEEDKENRRSSRRSVRNAGGKTDEENMAKDKKNKTDTENTKEDKENRRSSRRSVRNAGGKTDEENMAKDKKNKTDTENTEEDKENRRSSRRSVRNAGGKTDEENMAEDKENRRSSRRSVCNAEGNFDISSAIFPVSVATDAGNIVVEKEIRHSSRRAVRLQRQDAVDIETPVKNTRSRRKTAQTPASEGNIRSSRRTTNMLEGNEENFVITPTSIRSRRRL